MRSGFTLVEIVVVIAIISILSTFLVVTLNPFEQFQKASDAQRKSDLAQIQRVLEAYYQDYARYPEANPDNKIVHDSSAIEWGSTFAPYIDILPKDSSPSKIYIYTVDSNGQAYRLYASLDRGGKDPQACNDNGGVCQNVPIGVDCGAGGKVCNYGVSSPNVSP